MAASRLAAPLFVALLAACSKTSSTSEPITSSDAGDDTADALLVPPPIDRTDDDATLAAKRAACAFKSGDWPAQTIGKEYPLGDDIPIKHVIVIMQENRSFDHYLGRLVAQGYYQAGDFTSPTASGFAHSDQLDVPPSDWSMPDGNGGTATPHLDDQYCFTANHSWVDMHDDYDDGKNDHFVTNNNPGGGKSISYVDDTMIPFYYALASNFGVGDRYFASVMTSTWPNRFFLMAATSFGIADNSFDKLDTYANPSNQIYLEMQEGGHSWKDYTDGPHMVLFFSAFGWSDDTINAHYGTVRCDLMNDIANGTLPDLATVMGDEVDETSDEGPSNLPGIGATVVESIVRAVMASPSWKDTAIFITYDENGGTADHVPPADACPPDAIKPHYGDGTAVDGAFDKTGFRVPFIVVSPYTKKHFVSHVVHDHTSITRFIEAKFGLPALTARDANAAPPMEMFDFANPPYLTPPKIDAHTTVDPAVLTRCNQTLAPTGCP